MLLSARLGGLKPTANPKEWRAWVGRGGVPGERRGYWIFSSGMELERMATRQGERTMSMKAEATRMVCIVCLRCC